MYSKILIGTDGSDTATKAVRIGADLAAALGATPLLLYVGDAQKGEEVLARTASELGIQGERKIVQGDPDDKIIELAESEGVDLIVVGNKGMTGARRFLLGSVPNQVSHNAPCDLFIAKTT